MTSIYCPHICNYSNITYATYSTYSSVMVQIHAIQKPFNSNYGHLPSMRAYLIPYIGVRAAVDKNLYYFVVASFRSPIQGAPPSLPDIYSEVLLEYSYTHCSNIFNYT